MTVQRRVIDLKHSAAMTVNVSQGITGLILKHWGMRGCVRVQHGIPAAAVTPNIKLSSCSEVLQLISFNSMKHWVFPWWLFHSLEVSSGISHYLVKLALTPVFLRKIFLLRRAVRFWSTLLVVPEKVFMVESFTFRTRRSECRACLLQDYTHQLTISFPRINFWIHRRGLVCQQNPLGHL